MTQHKIWYVAIYISLLAMIMLGGATRLTHSGLSIVDWKPISGIIPPMNEADWSTEFERYKEFPEYQKINKGMHLEEFKFIFWMEFAHRLLGRLIGIIVLLPMLFFAFIRQLPSWLLKRSVWLLILGGLQGVMGWWMVKSGLVNDPAVSHYRLTAHLFLALIIVGIVVWTLCDMLQRRPQPIRYWPSWLWVIAGIFMLKTIAFGGFVAGLKAGLIYNTFPLMGEGLIPSEWMAKEPWWMNFFTNHATVQFMHRLYAILTLGLISFLAWREKIFPVTLLWVAVLVQVMLGISTLLQHVPAWLGTLHQGCAVVVFTLGVVVFYQKLTSTDDYGT
jgi:cytochrome c oxidase assembly protein subunit 15